MSSDESTEHMTHVSTRSDEELVVTRAYDAPRALVWAATTQPEHLAQWVAGPAPWSMTVCEHDLRPGGAYRTVLRHADGSEMEIRGEYREVSAPERLVLTERWGGPWPETVHTMEFTEEDGVTTVTLVIVYPSEAALDSAVGTGMLQGMAESYNRLEEHLATLA